MRKKTVGPEGPVYFEQACNYVVHHLCLPVVFIVIGDILWAYFVNQVFNKEYDLDEKCLDQLTKDVCPRYVYMDFHLHKSHKDKAEWANNYRDSKFKAFEFSPSLSFYCSMIGAFAIAIGGGLSYVQALIK